MPQEQVLSSGEVAKGGWSRPLLLAAAGIALVGCFSWMAVGAAEEEADPSQAATPLSVPSTTLATASVPTPVPATTEEPATPEPEWARGSVQIVDSDGNPASDDVLASLGSALMVLDSGQITLIDPTDRSAAVHELESSARLLQNVELVTDTHAVFYSGSGSWALPLSDLTGESVSLSGGYGQLMESGEEGTLWILSYDESQGPGMDLVDLHSGERLRSIDLPVVAQPVPGAPALLNVYGTGIYTLSEDRAQFVRSGWAVGASDTRVLVEVCDDELRCSLRWFDRESWRDALLPDFVHDSGPANAVVIDPTGRWAVVGMFTDKVGIVEIQTGELLDINGLGPLKSGTSSDGQLSTRNPTFSPDGRWFASAESGHVVLIDLENAVSYQIEWQDRQVSGQSGLAFIDRHFLEQANTEQSDTEQP